MKPSAPTTGFTLIELIIVIALLGALAIGLLATIDPFEQIKKGRDTSIRNTVAEIYNANLRYYATRGEFSWGTGTTFTAAPATTMSSDINALVNAGELKDRFFELAGSSNLTRMLITSTAADQIAVCFQPESKAFQQDPVTVYGSGGLTAAGCKSAGGTADCFLCIQ